MIFALPWSLVPFVNPPPLRILNCTCPIVWWQFIGCKVIPVRLPRVCMPQIPCTISIPTHIKPGSTPVRPIKRPWSKPDTRNCTWEDILCAPWPVPRRPRETIPGLGWDISSTKACVKAFVVVTTTTTAVQSSFKWRTCHCHEPLNNSWNRPIPPAWNRLPPIPTRTIWMSPFGMFWPKNLATNNSYSYIHWRRRMGHAPHGSLSILLLVHVIGMSRRWTRERSCRRKSVV